MIDERTDKLISEYSKYYTDGRKLEYKQAYYEQLCEITDFLLEQRKVIMDNILNQDRSAYAFESGRIMAIDNMLAIAIYDCYDE